MSKLIFLFFDGVGAGKPDKENNPFFKYSFSLVNMNFSSPPYNGNLPMTSFDGSMIMFEVDPMMGIEGYPQSGTGQTSILCGINASKVVGQHFGPFPHSTLLPYLENESIITAYIKAGKKVDFFNAYPQIFFDYINSGKQRLGAFATCARLNGLKLNGVDEVLDGTALTAEITGERWNKSLNYSLPVSTPENSARRLLRRAAESDLLVYEYFLTDHIGHGRVKDDAELLIHQFDRFLYTIFSEFDKNTTTVFLCSDHGNFEDTSVKSHTMNPAIAIAAGQNMNLLSGEIKSLPDIKPAILKYVM